MRAAMSPHGLLSKANEITKDSQSSTNINIEGQTIDYLTNPSRFKEDLEIAILEGKSTVEGAVKKIDNILHGSNNSDISEPEKRRYEEIKGDILRFKTAPEMTLIAEGDLGDKKVQEQLGIGGKFNPDDPNLPVKIRERIEEAREAGKEVTYFYDKVTGKIYINENADENTVRSGIAREWGIRDRFEKGKAKPNTEGDLKATVAGEIAYSEIENRLKGKGSKGINPEDFEYGVFDTDSEITGDFTIKHIEKGIGRVISATEKALDGDFKGSLKIIKDTVIDTSRVLKRDNEDFSKGGMSRKKVVEESTEALKSAPNIITKEVGKAVEKKKIEKAQGKKKLEEELSSKDCNGKCIKEQQKSHDDLGKDYSQMLSCRTGSKDCNPKPNNTSELIIFKTDRELEEYSNKLKEYGIRGNYKLDSQERIDRNYNTSSTRGKQAIDYERVSNIIRNESKSVEELYRTGKISDTQYKNYRKESDYIKTVNGYGYLVNNVISPIYNSIYLGVISNGDKTLGVSSLEKGNTGKTTGDTYIKRDNIFINDGTPGGTVKVNVEAIGSSNIEVSRLTNTYTGTSITKVFDKGTGAIYRSSNVSGSVSGVPLLSNNVTSGSKSTVGNIGVSSGLGSPKIIEVNKNEIGNKEQIVGQNYSQKNNGNGNLENPKIEQKKEPKKETVNLKPEIQNQMNSLQPKVGGRWGNIDTRLQNQQITEYLKNESWKITGGIEKKEEYMEPLNPIKGSTKGGNYIDVTATKVINGEKVIIRINTVDTYKRTGNLTKREANAAEMINIKIQREGLNNPELITIPKGKGIGNLEEILKKIEEEKTKK
ncbi:hypothetical protein EII29_10945 [Leptotrichia sp. OH3620_COT-345]|uniref:hypothetical protein n=1 Tax=Leptotrichia sp. OH3620_COT-345 TaxID=2491048 RepID=UPI000F65425E|nr:hypothetical protein [Leptotrichia sp. OH3620_COT-345]RRD37923.1 hypothetical protein EII29_10945 [Leptotrichia sp. OH3620_COT-345]